MTEKRFTTVELPKPNKWGIWHDGACLSTYQVCTLLNEYVDVKEENEQLKNSGQYWYDEHKRIVNNYVDKIKEVEKENEQLKLDLKVANDGADLYKDINEALEKENEQLKQENKELQQYLGWQDMELEEMEDIKR